ncbi:MAG: ABC transporter permease, partial [Rubrivivax sp.]|nr:ABC transporter permease [Rubrivivax sp.]
MSNWPKFVLLWTDASIWLLVAALVAYVVMVLRKPQLAANWGRVFRDAPALASSLVLLLCLGVTLLDSVHYRARLPAAEGAVNAAPAYEARTRSLLDDLLADLVDARESTYSRPLSYLGFTKESLLVNGEVQRVAPRLQFGGAHLKDPSALWLPDIAARGGTGLLWGGLAALLLGALGVAAVARASRQPVGVTWGRIWRRQTAVPWHVALQTLVVICLIAGPAAALSGPYHLLGTDLTGNDVLYQSLKSIRTAFVIGTLATVATLPLAVVL